MTWLLTGGAGYIGSHVVRRLLEADEPVVVLDDLSTGHKEAVPDGVEFVHAQVGDGDAVRAVLRVHDVSGVIHFAAKKSVPESVADPLLYYEENVGGLVVLLQSMVAECVHRIVFSSSAAVYGMADSGLVDERAPTRPENPYGRSKLMCEQLLHDAAAAHGLSYVSLRYFNAAGTSEPELVDRGITNLIPLAFRAVSRGEPPLIYGDDYPTLDGTGVRDFIHVADLADAHLAAARGLEDGLVAATFNVGRGAGYSVRQVLNMIGDVTGLDATGRVVDRRLGDPAAVVADVRRIKAALGWTASHDLEDMVRSAWDGWLHLGRA
jgi:UDP-glucose 4-epimerase